MTSSVSVFDSLLGALQKAADYNRDDTVPPAAVLWPDEKREWERLVPRLRAALPQFLTFGTYDAAHRSGPAIWLALRSGGKDCRSDPASRNRADHLFARGEPGDAAGHGRLPARVEAAGRVAVSGRDLVAGQRKRLDHRRLPPDGKRRAAT